MSKQLKQKQKQNKTSKKKRGGSGEKMHFLASLKGNTQMILADIERIEDDLPEGAPDENCDLSEIKKNAIQANVLIKNLIEEEQNQTEEQTEEPEKINPLDQVITTNGFTGTIGELLSKIREKIVQLTQYNNAGRNQTVAHLKTLLDSVSSESANVNKIKELLKGGRVKFKNNRVLIAKTKRRRKNKKRKIQTKRR
uniref:Uncharacterized protein n=1 Tax=viral metagenome TaxID=1070528 RepID=A0A6C0K064_9ZZZZ